MAVVFSEVKPMLIERVQSETGSVLYSVSEYTQVSEYNSKGKYTHINIINFITCINNANIDKIRINQSER